MKHNTQTRSSKQGARHDGETLNEFAAMPMTTGSNQPIQVTKTRLTETPHLSDAAIQHPSRDSLITEAAYHRAEARAFAPGHELDDWLAAESEVDTRLLGEGHAY